MSLLAAGSEESVVRIWSLKGEKLRGLRSDYEAGSVKDGEFFSGHLKKKRERVEDGGRRES